jgi:hypothetical protein
VNARSRRHRVVGWSIVGVLGLALAWLVLVNVALWTGLVARGVSGERERGTIVLNHGFAWCVWPTRVHLSDVDLRIDRHGWQLAVTAESAVIDLDLLALTSRRFTADHVALHGTSVTYRAKRHPADPADPDAFAAFGPIEGFDAPVRTPDRPPAPAPDDAWAVDLPRMEADLERVWIDGVRVEMRGHATIGVSAVSGRIYGIAPTRIRIDEGIVFVGDALATTSLSGRVVVAVAPYAYTEIEGADMLRQVTGLAELRADLTGATALKDVLPANAPGVRGGGGPVALDLSVWSGVVTDGHLKYRTRSVALAHRGTTIRGALALDVDIRGDAPHAVVNARLRKVSARTKDGQEPWLRADEIAGKATIAGLDLAAGRGRVTSASAVAPSIELLDLGVLGDVGKSTTVRGGRGEASVHASYDDERGLAGEVEVSVRQVDVATSQGVRVRGRGRMTADVHSDPRLARVLVEPVTARLDDVSIRSDRGRTDGFWARVGAGRIRWDREAGRLDVRVVGEIDDLQPLLAQAKARSSMADVLQALEGFGSSEPLEIRARATVGKDTIDVQLDRAERSTLDLTGRWRRVGDDTRAAIMLGRLRLGLLKAGADGWDSVPAVDEAWLRKHERWVGQL